jgi:hypothetical protein
LITGRVNKSLRNEICEYLGIRKGETVKSEKVKGKTKIVPTSGLHKDANGRQLITIDRANMNPHLFKDHFCRGWRDATVGKDCYEFCKRTGGREIADHATRVVPQHDDKTLRLVHMKK